MARRNNPYIAGAPLRRAEGFFGRQESLLWVERELNAHANALVLFGQRRIGKTSLLLQLEQSLPQERFLPIYFDLQDQAKRPLGAVLVDLADTIVEEALLSEPDWEAFDDEGRFFRRTFLPHLAQEVGSERRLVLLLDEFDVLDQVAQEELPATVAANAFFPFLRRLMSENPWPAFVFISGRRAEDLLLDFTATFKTSLVRELWTLTHQSAEALIRQAERNGTLLFTDEAVARILSLTNGHPYLTQLLCQRLWQQAYHDQPATPPLIDSPEVTRIIPDALEKGEQALIWLWEGLGHAEKIYAAALAEMTTEKRTIPAERIIKVLQDHAARLRWRTREVVLASRDLVKRRILEEAAEGDYRFSIELFRRWVQINKPLRKVKDELDRIDPEAEQYFKLGWQAFRREEWQRAARYFEDALSRNASHFRARLYRGKSLRELERIDEAVAELEYAYTLDKTETHHHLIAALLQQAEVSQQAGEEQKALRACQRVLQIAPHEERAQALRTAILAERGEYDVFLSYAKADQNAAERLAHRLEAEGLRPFFDQWTLIPGEPWQEARQQALVQSRTCALLIGHEGWQAGQLWPTIEARAASESLRVIPVLLPDVPPTALDALPTSLTDTAWVQFGSHLDEEAPFYRLVAGIKGITPRTALEEAFLNVCPYRGLEVFEEEHAAFFYGREVTIEQMLRHLKGNRFLAVLGSSGSGKSSLVRAGLLPALRRGQLAGSQQWSLHIFKPGRSPLERLAQTLKQVATLADLALPQLIEGLKSTPRQLHLMTQLALSDAPAEERLVLVIDQFEELFTLCRDETERQAFIANLLYASANQKGRTIIVLTMRADFYAKCASYPDLAVRISQHQLLLSPMTTEELRQAIERPLKLVGLTFEKGLVERLLADIEGTPGALPLLAHALLELWARREEHLLTFAAYQEIGGIQGAIAYRADEIYDAFSINQQTITQHIMLRLTQPGEGTEDTRRRVTLSELEPAEGDMAEVESTIQTLADARLLTTNQEHDHQIVDVAHEALIRRWPRLQNWLDQNRIALRTHRRLTLAATDWDDNHRHQDYLYRGARLLDAQDWAKQYGAAMNLLEQTFLNASQAAQHRSSLIRSGALAAFVLILLISVGLVVRLQNSQELAQQKQEAAATAIRLVATAETGATRAVAAEAIAEAETTRAVAAEAEAINAEATAQAEATRAIAAQEEAQKQQAIAESRALAAQAQLVVDQNPQLAIWLGVEAVYKTSSMRFMTEEAKQVLYEAIARSPLQATLDSGHIDSINHAAWSSDNRRILTASEDGDVRVWDAASGEELLTLSGHSDSVKHAAWSGDSSRILTASADGSAKVWDAASGEELLTLSGHSDSVIHAAWNGDSSRILTASADGSAKVWDAASGEELLTLSGHSDSVKHAAWSGNSSRILTASADGSAKVWNAASGEELLTLSGHSDSVKHAAWSGDGSRILTVDDGENAKVWVWDATSGEELLSLRGDSDKVNHAAWSHDDSRILTSTPTKVWDAQSGALLQTLSKHSFLVEQATWSHDDSLILIIGAEESAKVWDAQSGTLLLALSQYELSVRHAAWSHDSSRILTTNTDNSVKVWRLPIGEEHLALSEHTSNANQLGLSDGFDALATSFGHGVKVSDTSNIALLFPLFGRLFDANQVAWSHNGSRILTINSDNSAKVWDTQSSTLLLTLSGHSDWVTDMAWSHDDSRIVTASEDNSAKVWDANSGMLLLTLSGHSNWVTHVEWSNDDSRILTGSWDHSAKVWDAASGEELLTISGDSDSPKAASGEEVLVQALDEVISPHSDSVNHVAWNGDSSRILTASFDGSAKVWDADSGAELLTLSGHTSLVTHAAWSSDSSRILTASKDGSAKVWDAYSGQELLTLSGHTNWVNHAAWNADSSHIVTASRDGSAKVWDAYSGEELLTLSGHSSDVYHAVWSGDSSRIATASGDGSVKVWDAKSGALLMTLSGHSNAVIHAAWSPDDKRIVTANVDGTARIHFATIEGLLESACQRSSRNMTRSEWERYMGIDVPYERTCPKLPIPPS